MSSILIDLTPLRLHADFRRLYIGTALSAVGAQLASTAIALQVYDLTSSSFAVGLVGLFGLIPLVALGLYGGAIVDAFDRKMVALASALLIWVTGMLNTLQAALGNTHAWVLYALVALNSAAFAINSPARQAIYPRILPAAQLPAANALFSLEMSLAMLIGPTLAGFLVQHGGYVITYGLDAALFVFALWGLAGLPAVPTSGERKVPGLRSVVEGLGYLAGRPNLRMTFFTDFCAMILANPRALFPAVAALVLGGGSLTVGYLNSALAAGAMVAALLSGYLPRVVFQGRAVVGAVTSWGLAIAAFGAAVVLTHAGTISPTAGLVLALAALAWAGASDSVSMVFRNTIMQASADDAFRGRLQGVFIVVVAGGPRLGELVAGALGEWNLPWAAVVGGAACVVGVLALAATQRGFLRYDARRPTP